MIEDLSPVTIIHVSTIIMSKLSSLYELSFDELNVLTQFDERSLYMIIGYLFKEGRLLFFFENKEMKIRLFPNNK